MDIFLEQNCSNLIDEIKECGYTFDDVIKDPLYCIFGWYTKGVEISAKHYGKEIDAAIKFANDYDVDINEFDLSTNEKKVKFAFSYLALQLQNDYPD